MPIGLSRQHPTLATILHTRSGALIARRTLAHLPFERIRPKRSLRQPFPVPGGKWLISTEGGIEPIWSRSGRELFYRNGDKMMAVEIQSSATFRAGTPPFRETRLREQ